MILDFVNKFLALCTIISQILIILTIIYFLLFQKKYPSAKGFISKNGVLLSFVVALVASLGVDGTTIRWVHVLIVWTEGVDGHANESYDAVAEHCMNAIRARGIKQDGKLL